MSHSLIGLELEMGGILIKFTQTAAETNGALHVQEARYPAHCAPPPLHRHPRQEEHFTIIEGALQFRLVGVDRLVRAGETLHVPRGASHSTCNPEAGPTLVHWETRPALRTGEFFAAMGRAGRARARPRLADAAAILTEFRDEFQLVNPPPLVQRIVFGCLAPFGRQVLQAG